jgi:hypothetical protein
MGRHYRPNQPRPRSHQTNVRFFALAVVERTVANPPKAVHPRGPEPTGIAAGGQAARNNSSRRWRVNSRGRDEDFSSPPALVITASEGSPDGSGNPSRGVGAAHFQASSVAPHAGGVTFWVNIGDAKVFARRVF